jgi:hypothetical protein
MAAPKGTTCLLLPLAGGKGSAKIDVADVPLVVGHTWRLHSEDYAYTSIGGRAVLLHRLIAQAPPELEVDHRNLDRLDCRRANLRLATKAQQQHNTPARRQDTKTSRYKGVGFHQHSGLWRVQINVGGRKIHRYYRTEEEAARGYDALARQHFGAFARCNFAPEGER